VTTKKKYSRKISGSKSSRASRLGAFSCILQFESHRRLRKIPRARSSFTSPK